MMPVFDGLWMRSVSCGVNWISIWLSLCCRTGTGGAACWGWRSRLLGLAVGALLREWSLAPAVRELIQQPTGMSIVPAGGWLIVQHQHAPAASPEIELRKSDVTLFDGEVGWILTRLQALREGALTVDPDEVGPNYGQSLQSQLALYELLCSEN